VNLRDIRTHDQLIIDDFAMPDGSLADGQYVIELRDGETLLHAFRADPGPIDFGDRTPKHEDTPGARWKPRPMMTAGLLRRAGSRSLSRTMPPSSRARLIESA